MRKRLLLLSTALLLAALVGAPSASAGLVGVETGAGNPTCDGFKVDPVADGTYWDGSAWFAIDVQWTSKGPVFDWESNFVVTSVTVKGGPAYNLYMYAGDHSGQDLHAPLNPRNPNGMWYGLSHLCFEASKKS